MKIFSCSKYLDVIRAGIEENSGVRGYQSRLAEAAGMHTSYLSRVLKEEVYPTLDQAANLCEFWNLTEDETEYFLGLLQLERAASSRLKKLLHRKLSEIKKRHEELGDRIIAEKIDVSRENIYYSAWYYSAIHVLIGLPNFQTEEKIANHLRLPRLQVAAALATLEQMGLIVREGQKWRPTSQSVHLSNKSWMAAIHHANWRIKTTEQLQYRSPESVHYSGLHTLSQEDFLRIRETLHDQLVKISQQVRDSKEELMCFLSIDWYRF